MSVFESLSLDGAMVTAIEIEPLKKIHLQLFYFPVSSDSDQSAREFDLQFSKIADFKVNGLNLSSKLVSHNVRHESPYLDVVRNRHPRYSAKFDHSALNHFELILESGRIDVIAESVYCALIWQV